MKATDKKSGISDRLCKMQSWDTCLDCPTLAAVHTQELKRQAHIFIKCMYGGLGLGVILRTTVHFLSDRVSRCWRLLSRLGCWPVLQGRSSDSPVLGFQAHTHYQTQHFYMSSRELNSGPQDLPGK